MTYRSPGTGPKQARAEACSELRVIIGSTLHAAETATENGCGKAQNGAVGPWGETHGRNIRGSWEHAARSAKGGMKKPERMEKAKPKASQSRGRCLVYWTETCEWACQTNETVTNLSEKGFLTLMVEHATNPVFYPPLTVSHLPFVDFHFSIHAEVTCPRLLVPVCLSHHVVCCAMRCGEQGMRGH